MRGFFLWLVFFWQGAWGMVAVDTDCWRDSMGEGGCLEFGSRRGKVIVTAWVRWYVGEMGWGPEREERVGFVDFVSAERWGGG